MPTRFFCGSTPPGRPRGSTTMDGLEPRVSGSFSRSGSAPR